MTWLILGAEGQLGRCLQDELTRCEIKFVAMGRSQIDITNYEMLASVVREIKPMVVANSAAWTDVDGAESNPEKAFAVNAAGAANVARLCALLDIKLIHMSTDYVFDGKQKKPYRANDLPQPLGVYGRSKREGEIEVLKFHPEGTWIVRTAWLYSPYGKNFARTIARKGLNGENLTVVNDSIGQPTSALALASHLVDLVHINPVSGIYHGTNSGSASWYDFARAILSSFNYTGTLDPVSSQNFKTIAMRPKYSVLDHSSSIENNLSVMPAWTDSLAEVLPAIIASVEERI